MKLDFLRFDQAIRDLRKLNWPAGLKVLVLAPHPDDFDAIGVTLKFLEEQGQDIYAAVCVTGSGIDEAYGAGMSLEDKRQLRIKEQSESARFFGLREDHLLFLHVNNEADDQLADDNQNRQTLTDLINRIKPDLIFSPHGNDTNRAHRTMFLMVSEIASKTAWPLALMLNRDAKTLDMRTDFFLAFDDKQAAWKGRLLRFHDSQHQRNLKTRGYGFDERVLRLNQEIAKELKLSQPYAAAYEVCFFD